MLIALAGPVANFILAFGLMTGAYMLHNEVNEYISGPAVTDYISPSTPVAKTGIHSGDTIVHFDNVENPTWEDVLNHSALNLEPDRSLLLRPRRPAHQHHLLPHLQGQLRQVLSRVRAGAGSRAQDAEHARRGLTPVAGQSRRARRPQARRPDRQHRRPARSVRSRRCSRTCRTRRASPRCSTSLRDGQHLTLAVTPELTDSGRRHQGLPPRLPRS